MRADETRPPDATMRAARRSPRLEAAQHRLQAAEPAILTPACPSAAVPQVCRLCRTGRPLRIMTVSRLRRLRRRLTPAQNVPVCLRCSTSRASARLS